MLAPIAWRTPPRAYGPWELVTSLLTEALVARGVDVTLFATADSITAGKLEAVVPSPYEEDPAIDAKVWEYRHLSHCFAQANRFDLIHNQADFPAHAFAPLIDTPMVTTIHGFSSDRILPMYAPFDERVHYVAISEADQHPGLRYAATIHHGIRVEDFPFDPDGAERRCCSSGASTPTRARAKRWRRRARAVGGSTSTASCRTRTTRAPRCRRATRRSAITAWSAARNGCARWARRARCFTSSISTSRSVFR